MENVLTTELLIQLAMMFGAGALGAVSAFTVLRIQVRRNTKDIGYLRKDMNELTGNPTGLPVYVRRDEFLTQAEEVTKKLVLVNNKVDGLQRYARHQLTKDGMPLVQVNELLGDH